MTISGLVRGLAALAVASTALMASIEARAEGATCSAHSGRSTARIVELYTSEGCNSCPPADRWLSRLKADPAVVALAFHVDYWDRLGWKDRFASAEFTQRQARQQSSNGARFSYTPQVVVDGADRTDWPGISAPLPARAAPEAPVELALAHDGKRVTATVAALPAAPKRLAAYWAVTEQGHVSSVKAGENQGVTLQHDFVVRAYQPVAAWSTRRDAPQSLEFELPGAADPAHPREINLVVVDAETGKPLQAVKAGC